MKALNTAFHGPEQWKAFTATIRPKHPATTAWAAQVGARVEAQVAVRAQLPAHYTTAGAEAAAARLKSMLEQRSFSLRNKDRTNRLLGLVRLHLAGLDDPGRYHRVLRAAAETAGGRGAPTAATAIRAVPPRDGVADARSRQRWSRPWPTVAPSVADYNASLKPSWEAMKPSPE